MDWLRTDEVGVALGRSANQVYRLANYHGWRKVRFGKSAYYHREDIETYIESKGRDA